MAPAKKTAIVLFKAILLYLTLSFKNRDLWHTDNVFETLII